MPATASPSLLRKVLEDQFSLLATELVALFEQELTAREIELRQSIRDELAETLNSAVRMLRTSTDLQQMCAVLADSSATCCNLAAVFSVAGETARGEQVRGVAPEVKEQFCTLEFSLADAPALAGVMSSGDPVVAMTTPREISGTLADLFAHQPEDRAYILPIPVRRKTVAILYASGSVEMAPLELLAQAAALTLEAAEPPEPPKKPDLVVISGHKTERKVPESWTALSPQDQEVHLRAQRFARVQVAGMRLFSPELVKQGRASKDLYGALQKDIDTARDMFRQTFLVDNPTMLDYLHLELLRTLANDDPELFGENYPGPMA